MRSEEEAGQIEFSAPYTYSLEREGRRIDYFGAEHTRDSAHPQMRELKKSWEDFLSATNNHKRIVFVEGSIREPQATEEESIRSAGGEGGLISFLARQQGIDLHCPEPSSADEAVELLKRFSKEYIAYYYFARAIDQWHRSFKAEVPFMKYIEGHLRQDKNELHWDDFDFSLDHMKQIHRKVFGVDFDEMDANLFYDSSNPARISNPISEVARASNDVRNGFILDEIEKYWNDGFSIFIVYGSGHAVVHEPALRKLVTT